MTKSFHIKKSEVGEIRPSQALTTSGVGALVDLPNISVIVMGLDDWPVNHAVEIAEERLLLSVQSVLGHQVDRLLTPPRGPESGGNQNQWFDASNQIGMPVAAFPRWMVCSRCRLLAPLQSGLFETKVYPTRPDKACYVHPSCHPQGKAPLVLPARFLVTCERGHLDDFPWLHFVHRGTLGCHGPLRMLEFGPSGEMADMVIRCDKCGTNRRMAEVNGFHGHNQMPPCSGRRPHLRDYDPEDCDSKEAYPIALGASNLWFPLGISALSVPQSSDDLGRLIEENWVVLEKVTSLEILVAFRAIGQLKAFVKYTDAQIWQKLQEKQKGDNDVEDPEDLKTPEWRVFSDPIHTKQSRTFKLRLVESPKDFASYFEQIVLVEKLREVRALLGFSRLTSPRDFDSPTELPTQYRMVLSRKPPKWVPASETRGEGIFFQFDEEKVQGWVQRHRSLNREFEKAHIAWRSAKNIPNPDMGYPGIRFVLLHSFAHALIRQLAVECGYTSASITERIYSRNPEDGQPMAGVLIYTSASDSEGTLGGLCALGEPDKLGRHIKRALERVSLCSSDPLCSEHPVGGGETLHGASCHACSFLSETSCERGNKYLDRSVLVATVQRSDLAFFEV